MCLLVVEGARLEILRVPVLDPVRRVARDRLRGHLPTKIPRLASPGLEWNIKVRYSIKSLVPAQAARLHLAPRSRAEVLACSAPAATSKPRDDFQMTPGSSEMIVHNARPQNPATYRIQKCQRAGPGTRERHEPIIKCRSMDRWRARPPPPHPPGSWLPPAAPEPRRICSA